MTNDNDDDTAGKGAGRSKSEALGARDVAAKSRELAKRLPAVGYVTWLCTQSPGHRQLFLQDLEWRVFPPILLGQYKLHTDSKVGGLPTAYASWAFMSEEVEAGYRKSHKLRASDWQTGEYLWLVDFITPFGGAARLLSDLYYEIHKDREVKLLYPDDNGDPAETTLSALMRRHAAEAESSSTRGGVGPTTTH